MALKMQTVHKEISPAGQARERVIELSIRAKCWTNRLALRKLLPELDGLESGNEVRLMASDFLRKRADKLGSWRRNTIAECKKLAAEIKPETEGVSKSRAPPVSVTTNEKLREALGLNR